MELREKLEQVVDLMQEAKERLVASQPSSPDLAIYLHFYRGDEVAAAVQCRMDRDVALQAARVGAMGFNATAMAMTYESYFSELGDSPITGERWMHQEMQFVAQTMPEAFAKGWVTECLTTNIHERGGEYGMYSRPFAIQDDQVVWGEPRVNTMGSDEGVRGGGVIFEVLQQTMTLPTAFDRLKDPDELGSLLKKAARDLDEESRLAHCDIATFKILTEKDLAQAVVLSAQDGSARHKLLSERFVDLELRQ